MQFKHLRNSRLFFSAIIIIAVMFFANSGNVYSQCPPGFYGPYVTTFNLCPNGCPVQVSWCCASGLTTTAYQIHLNSISFLADPSNPMECFCLQMGPHPQYENNIPYVPFDRIMTGIVNSLQGCFTGGPPSGIVPCGDDDDWSLQFVFTSGGCYRYDNSFEHMGYFECEGTIGQEKCFESFEVCYEIIEGKYVIHTKQGAPSTPQFQCINGCHSLCDILTY